MGSKIDIVIPWVDSSDPLWRAEKNKYSLDNVDSVTCDDNETRYRDWDTIKYLFRSIEMYMPWVNRVFFLTYGHLPSWINKECEKLCIVKHIDFIPEEYLPTFCSHTIELNMHRIKGLAEQFIYFNDDILALNTMKEEDFFVQGMPRDYAILSPINSTTRLSVQDTALTDLEIINDNFNKNRQIKKFLRKWVSPQYGKELVRSFCLMPWPYFVGFLSRHQANAYLKSTFYEVWEKEFQALDSTCKHKFRTRRDVNQWVMRYWQLASGNFLPIKPYGEKYTIKNDNTKLYDTIMNSRDKTICINDNNNEEIKNYVQTKNELMRVLEQRYPKKSIFES